MAFFKIPVTYLKTVLWLCLFLIPLACQRENLQLPQPNQVPVLDAKVIDAQTWFEKSITTQPSVLKKGRNPKKTLLWQKAVSKFAFSQDVIAVPLDYEDEIMGAGGQQKLLLYKADKGYKMEIVKVLPDPVYLLRKKLSYDASDFTGKILIYDYDENFIKGYSYLNGKQRAIISPVSQGKIAQKMIETCKTIYIDYFTRVCVDGKCTSWQYSHSDSHQECSTSDDGGSGGGEASVYTTVTVTSGGGGSVSSSGGSAYNFPSNPTAGQIYVYVAPNGEKIRFVYDATLKTWLLPEVNVAGQFPKNSSQGTYYIYTNPNTGQTTTYIYGMISPNVLGWAIPVETIPGSVNFPSNPSDGQVFVSLDNLGNEIIYTYDAEDNTWHKGTGLPEFSVTDPSDGGQDLTVDKLRAIAKDNGYDFDIGNNYKVISEVFERAFMNCAVFTINGVTSSYVEYNDSPEKNVSGKVIPFQNSVRPNKPVQPDGLGPTGTRNKSTLKPEQSTYVPNSAFYEVKSGQTTLDLHYSPSNPDQLFAMLDALTRTRAHALKNATLFLVTCKGVRVADDLIDQARLMGVNLVQITPTIYPDNTVSFENARFLHRVPRGWLEDLGANIETFFIKRFTTPVPLLWNVHSGTDQTFEGD